MIKKVFNKICKSWAKWIPAFAGMTIPGFWLKWIPAFAGMTTPGFWLKRIPAFAGMTIMLCMTILIFSCNNNPVQNNNNTGQIVFTREGLVDSAVVTQCVPDTRRFFSDTLNFSGYSKIKVDFDGNTNSNGSIITLYYNTDTSSNSQVYQVQNITEVNGLHSFTFNKPSNILTFELRIYINPPVCGSGEFKYTRARDLKIYGIE